MIEYDIRVELTDVVRKHFREFIGNRSYAEATNALKGRDIAINAQTLRHAAIVDSLLDVDSLLKTVSLPQYIGVCPDEVKRDLKRIQDSGLSKLLDEYCQRKGKTYEEARAEIARGVNNITYIRKRTIKHALDLKEKRKKPVMIDIAVPLYVASKTGRISNYIGILKELGYRVKAEKTEFTEEDWEKVDRTIEILKAARKKQNPFPDGAVNVWIIGQSRPTDLSKL